MNRSDLKKLTAILLSDAKALLATRKNNEGAYYLAGYVVECAIKGCIAKEQGQYPFPLRIKETDYYTHSIAKLLETADLASQLKQDRAANVSLDQNWSYVFAWQETIRYETKVTRSLAANLINAIDDPVNGALTWLQKYW